MYRDEAQGLTPARLYGEAEAARAARWAEFIYGLAAQTMVDQEPAKGDR